MKRTRLQSFFFTHEGILAVAAELQLDVLCLLLNLIQSVSHPLLHFVLR
jgi:hypothetical protein